MYAAQSLLYYFHYNTSSIYILLSVGPSLSLTLGSHFTKQIVINTLLKTLLA